MQEIKEGHIAQLKSTYRNKHKSTILFMSIIRFGCNNQRHNIAFITDDFKFYYFTLRFAQHIRHMTYMQHDKIRDIFKPFNITNKTDILFQDTVSQYCPLYFYFKIIIPYIKFNMNMVSLNKIIKRIYYKHPSFSKRLVNKTTKITVKNVNMFLNRAWDRLIELDECPWITKDIDNKFSLISAAEARHQKRARICLYYMFVKTQYMILNKRCTENKNI